MIDTRGYEGLVEKALLVVTDQQVGGSRLAVSAGRLLRADGGAARWHTRADRSLLWIPHDAARLLLLKLQAVRRRRAQQVGSEAYLVLLLALL